MAGHRAAADFRAPRVGRVSEQVEQEAPEPEALCDVAALAAEAAGAGVLWKHTAAGRQLDANVVRLAPGARVGLHAEPELDVLLLVAGGAGALVSGSGRRTELRPGVLVSLPRGSARSLEAGPEGVSYLTVHRRRPGMQIRRAGG